MHHVARHNVNRVVHVSIKRSLRRDFIVLLLFHLRVQTVQLAVLLRAKFAYVRSLQRLGNKCFLHHVQLVLLRSVVTTAVPDAQVSLYLESVAKHPKISQNIKLAVRLLIIRQIKVNERKDHIVYRFVLLWLILSQLRHTKIKL